VIALPLGGYLCVNGFGGGWPSIFYIFGIAGVVWFVVWMILAGASPSEHRFISEKEKDYILKNTKAVQKEVILIKLNTNL
jgi:ACS family sodium-dependent inorganic phosphate cotransporter-like MFS transporter 5